MACQWQVEKESSLKAYMPKQPKHQRERVEAKLDERLVRRLEKYCQYLDSDRDYVLSQALDIAFRKDKGFTEWLAKGAPSPEKKARCKSRESRRLPAESHPPTRDSRNRGQSDDSYGSLQATEARGGARASS